MPWHDVSCKMFMLPYHIDRYRNYVGSYDNVWFYLFGPCPAFRGEVE